MAARTRAYGGFASPIQARQLAGGSLRLSQPRIEGDRVYWVEGRPLEGGRQVVVSAGADGVPVECTPDDVNVRNRVHEYGGGDYTVAGGRVFFTCFRDGSVRVAAPGEAPRTLVDSGAQHADFAVSPDGRWLVCVEERPREGEEPENQLLAIPLDGAEPLRFASGFDFVSFPRFAPDGGRLVFTAWCHPDMPWDATRLCEVAWSPRGPGALRTLAGGGGEESIFQPGFGPDGQLVFVSDRSGFWNLERLRDGARHALCPRRAEFGRPQWVFALSTWDFIDASSILCAYQEDVGERLARLSLESGRLEEVPVPFDHFEGVRVTGPSACFLGAGVDRTAAVVRLDLRDGGHEVLREAASIELDASLLSTPEPIRFSTGAGEHAHGLLYRPRNGAYQGPAEARPPLLVKSHGGPTGAASAALDLRIQFWTSRGFAVVDVDYRGSTGYGRAYRNRLRGSWGVFDVDDCVAAARFLAAQGEVDGSRLAISGGSAGGYTTLAALTFRDVFAAGASHYGIGDLETLVRDTHKFESRYCDRLIGPYPERAELYRERSPIHFTARLACPVAFFQGLEDRVVPPNQAEAMVAALAARGIPHAYLAFEGEQHGFRRAENIAAALEGELSFYGQIFGFDPDIEGAPIRVRT